MGKHLLPGKCGPPPKRRLRVCCVLYVARVRVAFLSPPKPKHNQLYMNAANINIHPSTSLRQCGVERCRGHGMVSHTSVCRTKPLPFLPMRMPKKKSRILASAHQRQPLSHAGNTQRTGCTPILSLSPYPPPYQPLWLVSWGGGAPNSLHPDTLAPPERGGSHDERSKTMPYLSLSGGAAVCTTSASWCGLVTG
jgi:hypothetical protein